MSRLSSQPAWIAIPRWELYAWLRAGFSTRVGGLSVVYGPGEQNLGWTPDDDAGLVSANRQAFLLAVARGAPMELQTLQQVHGCLVRDLRDETGPVMSREGKALLEGDGSLTQTPGVMLGILTADCVPVLIADRRQRVVAAIHAGWRGTVGCIVEHGIRVMQARYDTRPEDLIAAIGPAIGPCCFEVGEEVRSHFLEEFPYGEELVSASYSGVGGSEAASVRIDLPEANRRQLLASGVPAGNIQVLAECTACTRLPDSSRKYFSHRAEKGFTGRLMSVIGVASE